MPNKLLTSQGDIITMYSSILVILDVNLSRDDEIHPISVFYYQL